VLGPVPSYDAESVEETLVEASPVLVKDPNVYLAYSNPSSEAKPLPRPASILIKKPIRDRAAMEHECADSFIDRVSVRVPIAVSAPRE